MLSKNSIICTSCLTLQFYDKGQDLLMALSVFLNNAAFFFSEQLFCKQDEEEVTVQWMIVSTSHTSFLHAELHINKDSQIKTDEELWPSFVLLWGTKKQQTHNPEFREYLYSGSVIVIVLSNKACRCYMAPWFRKACYLENSSQMPLITPVKFRGEDKSLFPNCTHSSPKFIFKM